MAFINGSDKIMTMTTKTKTPFDRKSALQKPAIVIFDMDGTTVRHVRPVFLHALEVLDNALYKLSSLLKHLLGRTRPLKDYSHDPTVPRGLLVHRVLHKLRRKPVEQIVQPCPGIYDLLAFLKAQGIPLALASNGLGKGYGHDILEKFNLADYFDVELFAEDVAKSKPHPDGILRTLRALKPDLGADDIVWHIGDRAKDVRATIAADALSECKIIPFSYGLNAALAILKSNVGNQNIIMNYAEFLATLEGNFNTEKKEEN